MKNLIAFLKSKIFWVNVVLTIVVSLVLIKMALWFTNIYSHHGEAIEIPELSGKAIEEAEELLDDKNLRFEIVDSVFNREAIPGSVVDQFPLAGKIVKRARTVKLTIAAKNPEQITLGKVEDLSLRQAVSTLTSKGLNIEKLEYVSSNYGNLVTGFSYKGKDIDETMKIAKGESIVVKVGKGKGFLVRTPKLQGLYLDAARYKALQAGLNIGEIIYDETVISDKDKQLAKVWKQSIFEGNKVNPGSQITLHLSTKSKAEKESGETEEAETTEDAENTNE